MVTADTYSQKYVRFGEVDVIEYLGDRTSSMLRLCIESTFSRKFTVYVFLSRLAFDAVVQTSY